MLNKKFNTVLILATILFLSLTQSPDVFAEETVNPEAVLVFLENVTQIDMAKYTATLSGSLSVQYRASLGGLSEVDGLYALKSETSRLEVSFKFVNSTLSRCLVNVREGSMQLSQPLASNMVDAARGFLQRYQASTGDTSLQAMRSLLDNVDASKNTTKVSANVGLTVTVTDASSSFSWKSTYNGAVFSGLSISFHNGVFRSFGDDRSYVQIGSTDVRISEGEAVSLALDCAKQYSYTYDGKEISNFTIRNDRVTAELLTKAKDKPLVLYPYWMVTLPLGELYPGFVSVIVVEIWADTVEVASVYPLGIGGGELSPDSSSSLSPSPQLSPTPEPSLSPSVSPLTSPEPTSSSPQSPEPTASPSSPSQPPSPAPSLQPSESASQQPAENTGEVDFLPFVVAAAAVGVIVVAVAVLFGRKRIR